MIYETVELHNVEEITHISDQVISVQRVPEHIRQILNPRAQLQSLMPANVELRFIMIDEEARITLSAESETPLSVFFGNYLHKESLTITTEPQTFLIRPFDRHKLFRTSLTVDSGFSLDVVRLVFGLNQPEMPRLFIHDIAMANVRPPTPQNLPEIRYIAYGTSITQGYSASRPHLSWVSLVAQALNADLINLGMGGSAYCEKELADYIAGRTDWDIATLGLSVNMVALFSAEDFEARVTYLINTIANSNPNRSIVCITLFPYFRDLDEQENWKSNTFRDIVRHVVADCPHDNVHLVEGTDLLPAFSGLTDDILHPSDLGMITIAQNLLPTMRKLLSKDTPISRH
ncbi:MAG: SGNH/GDSL hydrolase family protein [Aggregatilineales bacterium]